MPSQNNSGQQYQKEDAVTVVATATVAANRFVGYDGTHATSAGGVHDSQGISEFGGVSGDALCVITDYSGLVEASAAVAFGDYIKPAADGSGMAAVGTLTDHCGRALGAASAAGQLVEVQVVRHVHA